MQVIKTENLAVIFRSNEDFNQVACLNRMQTSTQISADEEIFSIRVHFDCPRNIVEGEKTLISLIFITSNLTMIESSEENDRTWEIFHFFSTLLQTVTVAKEYLLTVPSLLFNQPSSSSLSNVSATPSPHGNVSPPTHWDRFKRISLRNLPLTFR